MNKTSVALVGSVAAHLALAAFVFSTATRHALPSVATPPSVATRVSLFPRPVERSVARAEAPPRHLVRSVSPLPAAAQVDAPAAAAPESIAGEQVDPAPATAGSVAGAAASSPTGSAPPSAGPLPLDVASLHAALAASARRCYPAAAKRFSLTGSVTVDFCLDGTGALTSTTLEGTSGQALLDAAARECVVRGALPLPAQAFGACYAVPVRFGN